MTSFLGMLGSQNTGSVQGFDVSGIQGELNQIAEGSGNAYAGAETASMQRQIPVQQEVQMFLIYMIPSVRLWKPRIWTL